MPWFAIRSVYHFGTKSDGTNIFEERVVCLEARDADEAHEKAAQESIRYAEENGYEVHPERDGYTQDGEPLIDGYEVWSILFQCRRSLAEFYAARYSNYDYHPE
jgi:hypothetical protein